MIGIICEIRQCGTLPNISYTFYYAAILLELLVTSKMVSVKLFYCQNSTFQRLETLVGIRNKLKEERNKKPFEIGQTKSARFPG